MNGSAIALMLVAIVIIWGGLITASVSLTARGHRERREALAASSAAAHAHLREGATKD